MLKNGRFMGSLLAIVALTIGAVGGLAPSPTSAATVASISEVVVGDLTYSFDALHPELGANVTNYAGAGGAVVIASSLLTNGVSYPVTGIDGNVFNSKGLTSATISDSVVTIGPNAFNNNKLTTLTIPDSVISIGGWAFSNNTLATVTIGTSVATIGTSAFYNNQLTTLTIPNSVITIGEFAFNTNNLTSVALGNAVTTIETQAFVNNVITSLTLGTSITSIGESAFRFNRLASLVLPNSLLTIGNGAFYGNVLTTLVIPDSVIHIGQMAFGDNGMNSVTLGTSVQGIGTGAFSGNHLSAITIPDSVTIIGADSFWGNALTTVSIPASVTTLGETAFNNNLLTSAIMQGGSPTIVGSAPFGPTDATTVYYPSAHASDYGSPWNGYTTLAGKTVTYDANGLGTAPNSTTVVSGSAAVSPVPPTAADYAFLGWFDAPTEGSLYDFGSTVTADITLYAHWALSTPTPTITGSAVVGATLTAVTGTWPTDTTLAYAWRKVGSVDVIGTLATYTLTAADRGATLTVTVTGTLLGTSRVSEPSSPTAEIAAGTLSPAPTPTISGTTQVGKTLTATAGTWQSGVSLIYAWTWFGSETVLGTASTYTLANADLGKTLIVTVTATLDGYTTASQTSVATATVLAGIFTLYPTPVIVGTATVGSTLTAIAGTWSPDATLSYAWQHAGSSSVIGTASSYTLVAADRGTTVTVIVTGTVDDSSLTPPASAATAVIGRGTLVATATPLVSGTKQIGKVLSTDAGTWQEDAVLTYAWKWALTTATIGTSSRYSPVAADLGKKLTVTVTATLDGYSPVSTTSAATTAIVAGTFALTPVPTVVGTKKFGETLTAVTGTWTAGAVLTYAWKRSGSTSTISTSSRYTLAAADVGKTLTVTVTGKRAGYTTVSKPSVATSTVVTATFTTSPLPTITGTATSGLTLTAVTSGWAPSTAVTFTYVWKRASTASGTKTVITGATSSTYRLVTADKLKYISVTVTASKSGYTSNTQTSATTYVRS